MNLIDEIKDTFSKHNNAIRKIIVVNIGVFLVMAIVNVILFFADITTGPAANSLKFFMLPASLGTLLTQPWSLLTYMFLHDGFFHILFNMLWLFWIGNILH